LGERCSFSPNYARYSAESFEQELENENLADRLMGAWPGGWPGQQIVELDNVGDPSDWLETQIDDMVGCLFRFTDQQPIIEDLALDYLRAIRKQGLPLPSDFGDDPSEEEWTADDEKQVRGEFAAFLEHWRERVLQTLEKQNAAQTGQGA
jgi:hypothetical protein